MEPQNVIPTNIGLEPENKNSHSVIIVASLVIVLLAVGAFLYINFKPTKKVEVVKPTVVPANPVGDLVNLQAVSATKLQKVTKQDTTSSDSAPASLKFFIPSSVSAEVSNIVYADKSKGYKATFKHTDSVEKTYKYFMTLPRLSDNYVFIEGYYNDGAGLLYLSDKDYTFKIDMVYSGVKVTNVSILVQPKTKK
ncbi:MAG: hypothetical protein ABL899_03340 [Nitrospira sp.]